MTSQDAGVYPRVTSKQVDDVLLALAAKPEGSNRTIINDMAIEAICRDWLDMRDRLVHFGWLTGDTFLDEYRNRYREHTHDELITMLASQRGAIGSMRQRIEDLTAHLAAADAHGGRES